MPANIKTSTGENAREIMRAQINAQDAQSNKSLESHQDAFQKLVEDMLKPIKTQAAAIKFLKGRISHFETREEMHNIQQEKCNNDRDDIYKAYESRIKDLETEVQKRQKQLDSQVETVDLVRQRDAKKAERDPRFKAFLSQLKVKKNKQKQEEQK